MSCCVPCFDWMEGWLFGLAVLARRVFMRVFCKFLLTLDRWVFLHSLASSLSTSFLLEIARICGI